VDEAWPAIKAVWEAISQWVVNNRPQLEEIWEGIKDAFRLLGEAVQKGWEVIGKVWGEIWAWVVAHKDDLQKIWENAVKAFSGFWKAMVEYWPAISRAVDAAWPGIKLAIELIMWPLGELLKLLGLVSDAWAFFFGQQQKQPINTAPMESFDPRMNLMYGDTPSVANKNAGDIFRMAAGGIVTRPTLAIVGESGPEAVIPLSRGNSGNPGGITFTGPVTIVANNPQQLMDALAKESAIRRRATGRR
jgi:hypothetical protein